MTPRQTEFFEDLLPLLAGDTAPNRTAGSVDKWNHFYRTTNTILKNGGVCEEPAASVRQGDAEVSMREVRAPRRAVQIHGDYTDSSDLYV